MSNAPATSNAARSQNSDRNDVLNAIGAKRSKFSRQELSALTTNDELSPSSRQVRRREDRRSARRRYSDERPQPHGVTINIDRHAEIGIRHARKVPTSA